MDVNIIAALTENNVIGDNNRLLWNLPNDMKFFRETTKNHHVIMGRKTYNSIDRPLPNRTNIVITRDKNFYAPCHVVNSLEKALDICEINNETEAFIIGGAEIYKLALQYANKFYRTTVYTKLFGDAVFPKYDELDYIIENLFNQKIDEKHNYAFTIDLLTKIK